MCFKVGDRVITNKDKIGEGRGVITALDMYVWGVQTYLVLLDGVTFEFSFPETALTLAIPELLSFDDKCECGLKYAREGGKHSDWCPMYQKETR